MSKPVEFLKELKRFDLSHLLEFSRFEFNETEMSDFFLDNVIVTNIAIISPPLFSVALDGLSEWDKRKLGDAITFAYPEKKIDTDHFSFVSDNDIEVSEQDNLFPEIIIHRNQMISVATGQGMIQELNDYYRVRNLKISQSLKNLGIAYENPHEDLWDWYHKWKESFSTYRERREYVNNLFSTVIESLTQETLPVVALRVPTGWDRVDRTLSKAHSQIENAHHEEDYQAIGLLCREILISLGQAVYNPGVHQTLDGVEVSSTDAGRMIEAFLSTELQGSSNESIRKYAKAALKLAVELQHKRTAEFRIAALCLEATASAVHIITILTGRRDRVKAPNEEI